MTATQTHTARSAMAVARSAYLRMAENALADVDDARLARVAERAFERGYDILLGLEATATDIALSSVAADAFEAHLRAIEAADLGGALSWLDLFPEIARDVRRDTELAPIELILQGSHLRRFVVRSAIELPSSDEYRPRTRQRTLALAS